MPKKNEEDSSQPKDIFSLFGPEVKTNTLGTASRSRATARTSSARPRASASEGLRLKSGVSKSRIRRAASTCLDPESDVASMSTVSSDLSDEKVENRREKQFIVDILKNADEKKEKIKAGGPMPDEVREMLGLPVTSDQAKRSKSEPRTPKKSNNVSLNSKVRQKSPTVKSPQKAKSTQEIFFPPSVAEKFEQQEKRNQIDAFLNKSRSSLRSKDPATPVRRKLSDASLSLVDKIPPVDPPSENLNENITTKLSLADVIIAAAAAKTVKLKSKEDVPPPTNEDVAGRLVKRLVILCQRGEWDIAGENLKSLEMMVAQHEIEKKVLVSAADSVTGSTPLMFAAIENRMQVMERLLSLGCDINKRNKENYTALHFASMYAREDTVNWLLAKRANTGILGGPLKQTCVHLASARRSGQASQIVRILLHHSAPELRYKEDLAGTIPLFCAVEATNNNVCKELLAKDAEAQLRIVKHPTGDSAMHLAARKKDHHLVKTMIEAGGQVDSQNNEGQTVLHLAAILGDEETMRVLFMARANAGIPDHQDRQAIHLAAERGYSKIVEFLADKFKASIYDRTRDGSTLMHIAAINGHPDTAMILFERGVPLLMPNRFGARSIHTAAKEGHVNVINTLIKKGEHVDTPTGDGLSSLHIAVEHGKAAVVEALLGQGANVHLKGGQHGETPLHIAARIEEAKGEKCTKMLVQSGADPNLSMGDGRTAIHIASSFGNLMVLRALLQNGGDAETLDKDGETPLHKACKECFFHIVRELLQFIRGFIGNTRGYVNKKNKKGETALHYASMISKGNLHYPDEDKMIVTLLMESGADVTIQTENNHESAFHYVAFSGNCELLQEMISHSNQGIVQLAVNKQNSLGWAPLLAASSKGHKDVVELLLKCNARVDVFDNEGRSALHLAADCGSMDVCQSLLEKNAFVNSKTKKGMTSLHFVANKGYSDLVDYLVTKHGATIESLTIKKQTPMHMAAASGNLDTIEKLVDLEAMVDSNDELDQKPIHLAAQHDHTNVVKKFLEIRPSLVSSTTKDGNTLAHLAAKKGSVDVLQAMFDIDATLVTGAKNRFNENTPLHLATEGGHLEAVKIMLANGVSSNDENKSGFTPVHLAAKCGHADVFDLFARTGISMKQPSSKIGMTALHIAAYYGEEDICRELFKHIPAPTKSSLPTKPENAMVEELCYEGDLTALHLASYSGSENVVRAVLNQPKVDVAARSTPSGYTALHLACLTGHVGVVGLLLSRSTELLRVVDEKGQSCLHIAASNGHMEMAQVLLGQGADCTMEDKDTWTALHCAAKGGYLDVVNLLTTSGTSTTSVTSAMKIPIWYACTELNLGTVTYLLRHPHDTYELLEDNKFIYSLMKIAKNANQKPIEEFIFVSPAPADTAAKLSASYRTMAETEQERATDLLEAADFCEEMARQLVITASHIESPGAILNAVDHTNTQFIDILIAKEQKMVISEFVVQTYLQDIWEGQLNWSALKMIGFFFIFVAFPPVWFFFSLPINFRMNKIPVIKFMSYLTAHIYFMLFLTLTAVVPPNTTVRASLFPFWYEIVSVMWYAGLFLAQVTNPGAKGGLAWVKPLIVSLGVIAVIIHFSAIFVDIQYRSIIMYVRNQFMGLTLLFCWIQILDFLAFHPLFGPWAIIIGECLLDVGKFVVVLSLFVFGYAMLGSSMNQPFGLPSDYVNDAELNPNNLTQAKLFNVMAAEEGNNPLFMFEVHFFALFGITSYEDVMASQYIQGWTIYAFKLVFASYLTLSIIVLINLLIAMMSDTYCRIQEQSDIEWKFGLAKLIRNMQRTYVAPTPLNLFTTWMVLIRKRYLELKAERFRAKMKFRRTMRDEIMQKAPGMKFVVEEQTKKKKKDKPRVIHALGNMKWGFASNKNNSINVDALQNKWDRENAMKQKEKDTFGSGDSLDEFRMLSKTIPWASVIRSYMETIGRGTELKNAEDGDQSKSVKDIMKSVHNLRNDRAKKEQAKKWSNMPQETKTKVIKSWEQKAASAP